MALEDLTGPAKFINSLVIGNPVSNDDRREGDDHIRGIKNVLRNTFPNINAAATITDEQLNSLAADLAALQGALKIAANLSDLASAFAALVNLHVQDANGHWQVPKPLNAGPSMAMQGFADAGQAVLQLVNAAGSVEGYLAHNGSTAQLGNAVAAGFVGLVVGGYQGMVMNADGETAFSQKASGAGPVVTFVAQVDKWNAWMAGASRLYQIMFAPAAAGQYMALTSDGSPTAPAFVVGCQGANATMEVSSPAGGIKCLASAAPVVTGPGPGAAANDASVATAAWVQAHTVAGAGSGYSQHAGATFGNAFQNTFNKARFVSVVFSPTSAADVRLELSPDNVTYTPLAYGGAVVATQTLQALVPPAYWYRCRLVSGAGTLNSLLFST